MASRPSSERIFFPELSRAAAATAVGAAPVAAGSAAVSTRRDVDGLSRAARARCATPGASRPRRGHDSHRAFVARVGAARGRLARELRATAAPVQPGRDARYRDVACAQPPAFRVNLFLGVCRYHTGAADAGFARLQFPALSLFLVFQQPRRGDFGGGLDATRGALSGELALVLARCADNKPVRGGGVPAQFAHRRQLPAADAKTGRAHHRRLAGRVAWLHPLARADWACAVRGLLSAVRFW